MMRHRSQFHVPLAACNGLTSPGRSNGSRGFFTRAAAGIALRAAPVGFVLYPARATMRSFSQATAYHEAGHAVVAWALGLRVGAVHVRDEDAGGGADVEPADHLNLVDQIAICSAGYAAEQVFGVKNHDLASSTDHAKIVDLLQAHGVSEEDRGAALRDEAHNRARVLLEQYRHKVIRLAQRLFETGSVSEAEFLTFIGE
jgi:hypothetical protein